MTTKSNATDKSNEIIDQSKKNTHGIGMTNNPPNAGMNIPNADEVAEQFKKANHISDDGKIDTDAFNKE